MLFLNQIAEHQARNGVIGSWLSRPGTDTGLWDPSRPSAASRAPYAPWGQHFGGMSGGEKRRYTADFLKTRTAHQINLNARSYHPAIVVSNSAYRPVLYAPQEMARIGAVVNPSSVARGNPLTDPDWFAKQRRAHNRPNYGQVGVFQSDLKDQQSQ